MMFDEDEENGEVMSICDIDYGGDIDAFDAVMDEVCARARARFKKLNNKSDANDNEDDSE